jgi:uncharacterized protein (DUF305 family)
MTTSGWMKAAAVLAGMVLSVGSAAGQGAVAQPGHTPADARFMQQMIGHHAQALEMAALVPDRTGRADLRMLAERITVSQRDEIALMQAWLRARGEAVPAAEGHDAHHAHHAHPAGADSAAMPGMAAMAGMATPEEMARLAALSGAEFDRLFLELMIRHHEGALVMVAELFATPGAGQGSQVFSVANEVEADQRMEIDRMRRLLDGPLSGPRPR